MNAKRLLSAIVAFVFAFSMVGAIPMFASAAGTDISGLSWSDIANDQIKSFVTKDLSLVTKVNGEDVTWTSSNPAAISATGKVTRSKNKQVVTLTASCGGNTEQFELVVPSIFSGNVKKSYSFDDKTTGTVVSNSVYTGFSPQIATNCNLSGFEIDADAIDSGNQALVPQLEVGFKKYTTEEKTALLESTNKLTYTSGSDNYEYFLEASPKDNTTGTYFNGLVKKNGQILNDGYYVGVYVSRNEGAYSVDGNKFRANQRWLYPDGSPYIATADGAPTAGYLHVGVPSELGTFSGGKATVSFRLGFDAGEETTRVGKDIKIFANVGKDQFTFGKNFINGDTSSFKIKFTDSVVVSGKSTASYVGKTNDTVGIYDDTTSLDKLTDIGSGVWRDVVVEHDYDTKTGRMYYNGKPVFWTVTSNGQTKYSSEIDISAKNALPIFQFISDRTNANLDAKIMVDDVAWAYITSAEKQSLLEEAALAWSEIANDQIMSSVTKDLSLVDYVVIDGVKKNVDWKSDNETVVSVTGKVARWLETKFVTLTATIDNVEKTFNITVPGKMEDAIEKVYSFDGENIGTDAGGILGLSQTSGGNDTNYIVSADSKDKNNKVLYFDWVKSDTNNTTKHLFVDALANASFDDGLFSVNFRFAEPTGNQGGQNLVVSTMNGNTVTNMFTFARGYFSIHKNWVPEVLVNNERINPGDHVTGEYVSKTSDLTGTITTSADRDANLKKITRNTDEWHDVSIKYDINRNVIRFYYDGKPVYYTVTYNDNTIYSSDIVLKDTTVPKIRFSAPSSTNGEFYLDDVKLAYTSAQKQAEILVNELPYVKAPVVETELVLGDSANVSYSASKLAVDELTAAVNSTIGFGTEADVITATATVNGRTATKEHEIIVKKRVPYAVNSVVLTKDGARIYTPVAGAVLEKLTFDVNSAKTNTAVYIAKYDAQGNLAGIVTRTISASGEALVNITFAEGETYKVFTFDGGLVPCNLPEDFAQTTKENVKLFVIGDDAAKGFGAKIANSFTENVTVDNSQALIGASAKTALSGGSLDYVLANGTAGDYVLVGLGANDANDATAAQFAALISQIVKAVENAGMTAILVTPAEANAYTTAVKAVATKYGVLCADASTLADANAQAVATYISTQIKSALLTISAYVK